MIYIIASNVGLALMMIIAYVRYSKLKVSSAAEILELHKRIDQDTEEKRSSENDVLLDGKSDSNKVEELLREIDSLRKEKESEVRLRLEAEKQIELALNKTTEIQERMQDWSAVQDAAMKDSKDAIYKVGNDLFKKLNETYLHEAQVNKTTLGTVSKNITGFFDKVLTEKLATIAGNSRAKEENSSISSQKPEVIKKENPPLIKIVVDIVELMKANGQVANKDYFLSTAFDTQKSKLFLCELALISLESLYILDFKACHYFAEYQKAKDKAAAAEVLKHKLDKYFLYLSNSKYSASILKALDGSQAQFSENEIVIILPSKVELQIMKDIQYYGKAKEIASNIMNLDDVHNLIL